MTPNPDLKVGSIVQINPEKHPFGGDFIVVKELWSGGVQGYVANVYPSNLIRYIGVAYLRVKWEDLELVGYAEWILEYKKEDEMVYQNDNQDDRS